MKIVRERGKIRVYGRKKERREEEKEKKFVSRYDVRSDSRGVRPDFG